MFLKIKRQLLPLRKLINKMTKKSLKNQNFLKSANFDKLYQAKISLIKSENEIRTLKTKINRLISDRSVGDKSMSALHNDSGVHSFITNSFMTDPHDESEMINVADENRNDEEMIRNDEQDDEEYPVTQCDLEGEEQLEKLDNEYSFGYSSELNRSCLDSSSIFSNMPALPIPIDLTCSTTNTVNINHKQSSHSSSPCYSPHNSLLPPGSLNLSVATSMPPLKFSPATIQQSNLINPHQLPSRRSTDDHLEQYMRVDPSQNQKWRQLADKYNKELGPNVCGVCHKTLSCKSALTMHYRVHTEERPFVCIICEKRFSTKGNLKTHLGQHADVTEQFYQMGVSSTVTNNNSSNHNHASNNSTNQNPSNQNHHHHHQLQPPPPPHLLLNNPANGNNHNKLSNQQLPLHLTNLHPQHSSNLFNHTNRHNNTNQINIPHPNQYLNALRNFPIPPSSNDTNNNKFNPAFHNKMKSPFDFQLQMQYLHEQLQASSNNNKLFRLPKSNDIPVNPASLPSSLFDLSKFPTPPHPSLFPQNNPHGNPNNILAANFIRALIQHRNNNIFPQNNLPTSNINTSQPQPPTSLPPPSNNTNNSTPINPTEPSN